MKHPVCKTFEEAMDVVNSSQHQVLEMHSHCCFTENNLTPLCQGIRTNRNLVVLILGGLGLKGSAGRELGRALRTHPVLQELHLHNNKLGYEGVQLLSEELASSKQTNEAPNRELKVLVLRNNDIGRHCISSCNLCRFSPDFPSGLLQVTCLHVIDLNANRIEILPLQLALMPNLVALDVRGNPISNVPMDVMLTARKGHQGGWPQLREWMKEELQQKASSSSLPGSILSMDY